MPEYTIKTEKKLMDEQRTYTEEQHTLYVLRRKMQERLRRKHPDIYALMDNREFRTRFQLTSVSGIYDFINLKTETLKFTDINRRERIRTKILWIMFFEYLLYHKERFYIRIL